MKEKNMLRVSPEYAQAVNETRRELLRSLAHVMIVEPAVDSAGPNETVVKNEKSDKTAKINTPTVVVSDDDG